MSRKLKFFAVKDFDEIGNGIRLKGTHSEDHLVDDNPKRPNIGFVGIDLSFEHFRSHVYRRPQHSLGHLVC